ncbi:prestin-like [Mytilus galloprovincialis]|uniref:prestin-like n=1 Tax=Mytilus galloprovincialis TaxID=29158 RepID=UPI003F7CC4DA
MEMNNSRMDGEIVSEKWSKVVDFEEQYALQDAAPTATLRQRITGFAGKCCTRDKLKSTLHSNFPFINVIRRYKILQDLPSDIIAGLTVGIMQIPQGMAYALLASLPPICGLYTSFFGPLIYFFTGTSRHASMGTIAIVGLMIASVLDTTLGKDTSPDGMVSNYTNDSMPSLEHTGMTEHEIKKIKMATALSFVSGLVMVLLGKMRLGLVATYMSEYLVSGFTSGVAIHVVTSQMKHILGINVPRHNGVFKIIRTWKDIILNISSTNVAALLTSIVSMVILYIVKVQINQRFKSKLKIPIPIEIIVVAIATVISHFAKFRENFDVNVLKDIPAGIPKPDIPDPTLLDGHVKDAIIIGIVAFSQSVSMAKILAKKNNYRINPSQEMVAYGAGSVLCSLFSGYITAASVARSMVQDGAGGRTQVASLFGCLVVLVVIIAVGPLFYSLPKCVLSSVIFVNLRGMFLQFLEVPKTFRRSKYDFSIWLVTFLCTVILDADLGIAIGILYSLFTVALRTQIPLYSRLAYVGMTNIMRPYKDFSPQTEPSGFRVIQYQSPIYFANSDMFVKAVAKASGVDPEKLRKMKKKLEKQKKESAENEEQLTNVNSDEKEKVILNVDTSAFTDVTTIVLDFSTINFVDLVGVKALRRLYTEYEKVNIRVLVAAPNKKVLSILKAAEFFEEYKDSIYIDVSSALGNHSNAEV